MFLLYNYFYGLYFYSFHFLLWLALFCGKIIFLGFCRSNLSGIFVFLYVLAVSFLNCIFLKNAMLFVDRVDPDAGCWYRYRVPKHWRNRQALLAFPRGRFGFGLRPLLRAASYGHYLQPEGRLDGAIFYP